MFRKLKCVTPECRVIRFFVGAGEDDEWVQEECAAWSALRPADCPGCSMTGEEI